LEFQKGNTPIKNVVLRDIYRRANEIGKNLLKKEGDK